MLIFSLHWMMQNISILMSPRSPSSRHNLKMENLSIKLAFLNLQILAHVDNIYKYQVIQNVPSDLDRKRLKF